MRFYLELTLQATLAVFAQQCFPLVAVLSLQSACGLSHLFPEPATDLRASSAMRIWYLYFCAATCSM